MVRIAALALLCACIVDPRGQCATDADCRGGAAGSFCADGICQGPPAAAVDALPSRAFGRGESLRVSTRVTRSHGTASARVVFGGAAFPARADSGALVADVPLTLAPIGVEGAVPFSVEVKDDLGHLTVLPESVLVDDRPPRAAVDGAPPTAVLRGTQVVLHVTAEDLSPVTVAGGTRNADGSFSVALDTRSAPADATSWEVPIVATDAVGNAATVHAAVPVTRLKFKAVHPANSSVTSLVLSDNLIWALIGHSEFWLLNRSDGTSAVHSGTGGTAFAQLATDGARLFFTRSDDMICRLGADGAIQVCKGPYPTMSAGPILQGGAREAPTAIFGTTGTTTTSQRLYAWPDNGNVVPSGVYADFKITVPAVAPSGTLFAGAVQAVVAAHFDGLGWDIHEETTPESPHYIGMPAFRGNQVLLAETTNNLDTFTFLDPLGNPAPAPTVTAAASVGVHITSPTIAADGTVLVGTDDRKLIALRPNGSQWIITLPGDATAAPSNGAGDLLYVGTGSGDILALHLNDGSTAWSYAAGAPVRGPLALGCDGILYAGIDGAVLALIIDQPGLANSDWPKEAHDVRGTGDARRPLRSATGACVE